MRYVLSFLALLFSACSLLPQPHVKSRLFTMKSPNIKFSDVGYIKQEPYSTTLELYEAGHAVKRFKIDSHVCSDDGCITKEMFNKVFLSTSYPDEVFENILNAKPIFDSLHVEPFENGFEQKISKKGSYDIFYKVDNDIIYFKDKTNNILIKIKDIDNE